MIWEQNFNPHFREGSDARGNHSDMEHMAISIHTSAKEVTLSGDYKKEATNDFNPHFREGSDIIFCHRIIICSRFQSTLPRRKWRSGVPLPPEPVTISIHTSAKEVTITRYTLAVDRINFNPHFREGSD